MHIVAASKLHVATRTSKGWSGGGRPGGRKRGGALKERSLPNVNCEIGNGQLMTLKSARYLGRWSEYTRYIYIYTYIYIERSKGNEGFYLNILITVQFRAHVVALSDLIYIYIYIYSPFHPIALYIIE